MELTIYLELSELAIHKQKTAADIRDMWLRTLKSKDLFRENFSEAEREIFQTQNM